LVAASYLKSRFFTLIWSDVQIRIDNIPPPRPFRQAPRVGRWTAVVELVAPPMWQRESAVALADAGQIGAEIAEPMGDEMHHLAFPLDPAVYPDHARRQHDPAIFFKHLDPPH
jgi:hypothetical protein